MNRTEILENLIDKCCRCEGGDCYNCGQKPVNIEQAEAELDKLGLTVGEIEEEIVQGSFPDRNFKDITEYRWLTTEAVGRIAQAIHQAQLKKREGRK